jgi:hypothetical protein
MNAARTAVPKPGPFETVNRRENRASRATEASTKQRGTPPTAVFFAEAAMIRVWLKTHESSAERCYRLTRA